MRGIPIYPSDCEDFSTNGLGFLLPVECTVEELANGKYELQLVQPIADDERHTLAQQDRILKAVCPVRESPLYEAGGGGAATVTRDIYRVRTNGGRLRLRKEPTTAAKILSMWKPGTEVVKLQDAGNNWYLVSIREGGAVGYMYAGYLAYVRTITQTIDTKPVGTDGVRTVISREQLFRIYAIEEDTEEALQTIRAMHIFYDLRGTVLDETYAPEGEDAATCARHIMDNLADETEFTLHCEGLTGSVTGEYDYCTPVEAFLDGEKSVLAQSKGLLVRDNFDVFLLPDAARETGVTIRRGKNLIGVTVNTDSGDVVTRIIPCGKDKDGNPLFLEGTKYVDSPRLGARRRTRKIDYDVKVSTAKDSTIRTNEQARAELLRLANEDFASGIDAPAYGMDVDFILSDLNSAARHPGWAALQAVHLFDTVTVIDESIHLTSKVRVSGYVWDVLLEQYERLILGDIYSVEQTSRGGSGTGSGTSGSTRVANANIIDGSVSTEKIRDGAVTKDKLAWAEIEAAIREIIGEMASE